MDQLTAYYNKFNEEKRLDSRHGRVEYVISMEYIHACLDEIREKTGKEKEKIRILDVGAGTGRYALSLAKEGYDVTAVEYVKYNLGILKQKAKRENITLQAMQGDGRRLKKQQDDSFDLTLVFGPMYHLAEQEEKKKALKEALRVTKEGGFVLIAYVMSDYGVITYAFKERHVLECVEQGRFSEDYNIKADENELYDYMRLEEIDALNAACGARRRLIFSPDGPANYIRPFLNQLTEEEFTLFIDYQRKNAARSDLLGAAAHTVDILEV